MTLPPNEIHVWVAFDREFQGDSLLERLSGLLEPEERERAARMRARDLPRQHVVTRALQRLALSRYVSEVPPGDWRFVTSAHGKPGLSAAFGVHGIHFNVAHTSRLVAMAIGRHEMLGIDVETVNRRAPLSVAPRYFTQDEADALAALPVDEQFPRFFALWTLKESWLKATGAGFAGGLDSVSFAFGDATRARGFHLRDDDAAAWQFWQASPSDEHLLALGVRSAGAIERVRLFRWRPALVLEGEELEPPRPVR